MGLSQREEPYDPFTAIVGRIDRREALEFVQRTDWRARAGISEREMPRSASSRWERRFSSAAVLRYWRQVWKERARLMGQVLWVDFSSVEAGAVRFDIRNIAIDPSRQ